MISLRKSGLHKIKEGKTTVEEVVRQTVLWRHLCDGSLIRRTSGTGRRFMPKEGGHGRNHAPVAEDPG